MSKLNAFRIIGYGIIIILDLLLVPTLLDIPRLIKLYGLETPSRFIEEVDLLENLKRAFTEPKFRSLFLSSQYLVFALMLYMIWKNHFTRKNKNIKGIGGPKAAGAGEFGTARWLTPKEVDTLTTVWDSNKPMKVGGIVLGMEPYNTFRVPGIKYETFKEPRMKVWMETSDTHTLIIGTSRSGKTRTLILPSIYSIAHSGESMVINDPKGELYAKTSRYLEKQGYKVVLLDFRNPGRGNRWNPMDFIVQALKQGNHSLASEAALDMAHTIVHQKPRSGDPIWANGEESVIAALSLAIAETADHDEQKHLTSVYNTLIELGMPVKNFKGEEHVPLNKFFSDLPTGHIAKGAYGPAALAPDKTRGSFFSGAATDLRLFSDPGIANLTATQDHDLADVGREKTAVFLVVPDEKETRHVLASLYIDQCYQALVTLASQNKDRLPNRVNFILDEFGNMPPINGFDSKITVAAGRGIRYHMVIQDFAQLKEKYGNKAGTIKGNSHTWVYLLTTDIPTSEEISKKTGTYSVETTNYSSSAATKSYSHGMSSSLTGRALLTPDEVRRWEYGNALVFLQRQNPAHLSLPDYTKWPANEEFIEIEGGVVESNFFNVPIFVPNKNSTLGDLKTKSIDLEKEPDLPVQESILDSIDPVPLSDDAVSEDENGIEPIENEIEVDLEELEDLEMITGSEEVDLYEEYQDDTLIENDELEEEHKTFSLNDIK